MKDIRPTSGRVMSALFSILGDMIDGAEFLDLFAGTGRVGLEALRRGAKRAVFVEGVRNRADEIKRSLRDSDSNIVLSLEVRRALSWLVKREMRFTIIFADPPYNSGWCDSLPALPNLDALFSSGALMVIEHSAREPLTLVSNPHNLAITSQREYGETCLTFLQTNNPERNESN